MTINPPAPNPINHQFRFQILQVCSENFLTDPLPGGWYELTEIEQDDFLCDHAWQPLEYCSAEQIWELIDNSANTFFALLSNYNLTVDNFSNPQKPSP